MVVISRGVGVLGVGVSEPSVLQARERSGNAFDPRKRRLLLFCLVRAKARPNLLSHRRARLYTQVQAAQSVWAQ